MFEGLSCDHIPIIFLAIVASYLVGSIPVGYMFARFMGIDITQVGSGNIGASNVARILGYRYFLLIFIADAGKAMLSLLIIRSRVGDHLLVLWICALLLMIGNGWSIFLKFRGGRGVSTLIGILAVLVSPILVMSMMGLWIILLGLSRRPAIASGGALLLINCLLFWQQDPNVLLIVVLSLIVIYLHRSYICFIWHNAAS